MPNRKINLLIAVALTNFYSFTMNLDIVQDEPLHKISELSSLCRIINEEDSAKTHNRFLSNPLEFSYYHEVYKQTRKEWTIVPFEEAIKWCLLRPNLVIGDFGCGEGLLAKKLKNINKVYSFDHIALNDDIIACDMSEVPLDDAVLDAVIFSLSLMGANYIDYLKEAKRCLKLDGHLWIAEPIKRIKNRKLFKELLDCIGFDIKGRPVEKGKFVFIVALKSERECNEELLNDLAYKNIL